MWTPKNFDHFWYKYENSQFFTILFCFGLLLICFVFLLCFALIFLFFFFFFFFFFYKKREFPILWQFLEFTLLKDKIQALEVPMLSEIAHYFRWWTAVLEMDPFIQLDIIRPQIVYFILKNHPLHPTPPPEMGLLMKLNLNHYLRWWVAL